MLRLHDFYHLPPVAEYVRQWVDEPSSLALICGLDPQPTQSQRTVPSQRFSGRVTVFRLMVNEFLAGHPGAVCMMITEDRQLSRFARQFRDQAEVLLVDGSTTYEDHVAAALEQGPDLLVIDPLSAFTLPPMMIAVEAGLNVLSQIDVPYRGSAVFHQLAEWGLPSDGLGQSLSLISVQHVHGLCPHCRQPATIQPEHWMQLTRRYPDLDQNLKHLTRASGPTESGFFFESRGCPTCQETGYIGEKLVFDFLRVETPLLPPYQYRSQLMMSDYLLQLAKEGVLSLTDLLGFEEDYFRHVHQIMQGRETELLQANADLRRRVAELEAGQRVLEQRTRALISLQDISQALIESSDPDYLAARVCQRTHEICGADHVILYLLDNADTAKILAVSGWPPELIDDQARFDAQPFRRDRVDPEPFAGWPPGVQVQMARRQHLSLKAGLLVPLIADKRQVGFMIVNTLKRARFHKAEMAMLQTFASYAALTIQRAILTRQLQEKIAALEDAQRELLQKERLERELELARQVQQSVVPQTFPVIPGFEFAARYEPARQVGGDFYDVIRLDNERVGLVIGDVSDKGMPAALFMALTRSLILAEARREASPQRVLYNVNQLLCELGKANMFVTVFYGVVDIRRQSLVYARAGHDLPLLLQNGSIHALGGEGIVLGLLDQEHFFVSEENVALSSGDRLVLYTDGLTDVQNDNREIYAYERFQELVEHLRELAPHDFCETIFEHLDHYRNGAEQFDDMTLLIMRLQ